MGPRAAALQHELRVGPLNQLRHGPAPPPRLPFSILPLGGGVGERAGAASTLVDTLQRALLRLGVALGERIGIERVAAGGERAQGADAARSEEHTSELQSPMRLSYAVFCLKKKKTQVHTYQISAHSR